MSPDFASAGTVTSMPVTSVRFQPFGAILRCLKAFINQPAVPGSVSARQSERSARPVSRLSNVPVIKACTRLEESNNTNFAGRSVLCVGGQKHLYPAYQQIIEDAGGRFLCFHGGNDASLDSLHRLLALTDLVICPIDCIRHEAFWITKRYCERLRKPCVMLDKSRITAFYNGIRMLRSITTITNC
ncbi:hypothetical protein SAMN05216325_10525 [Nitrosomonas marina]|uniref:DUF2325 domain-containing protein n=2 Tax=Nitrosomonas marina TaxID=917 RepID=A0A1H8CL66_9PROT|nr:hypothetical protein SAMN05216325_10525 [Nitrosomonas marina]